MTNLILRPYQTQSQGGAINLNSGLESAVNLVIKHLEVAFVLRLLQ